MLSLLAGSGFASDYNVVDHVNGKIYILTNWKAPKQRLMEVDPSNFSRETGKKSFLKVRMYLNVPPLSEEYIG